MNILKYLLKGYASTVSPTSMCKLSVSALLKYYGVVFMVGFELAFAVNALGLLKNGVSRCSNISM